MPLENQNLKCLRSSFFTKSADHNHRGNQHYDDKNHNLPHENIIKPRFLFCH